MKPKITFNTTGNSYPINATSGNTYATTGLNLGTTGTAFNTGSNTISGGAARATTLVGGTTTTNTILGSGARNTTLAQGPVGFANTGVSYRNTTDANNVRFGYSAGSGSAVNTVNTGAVVNTYQTGTLGTATYARPATTTYVSQAPVPVTNTVTSTYVNRPVVNEVRQVSTQQVAQVAAPAYT